MENVTIEIMENGPLIVSGFKNFQNLKGEELSKIELLCAVAENPPINLIVMVPIPQRNFLVYGKSTNL